MAVQKLELGVEVTGLNLLEKLNRTLEEVFTRTEKLDKVTQTFNKQGRQQNKVIKQNVNAYTTLVRVFEKVEGGYEEIIALRKLNVDFAKKEALAEKKLAAQRSSADSLNRQRQRALAASRKESASAAEKEARARTKSLQTQQKNLGRAAKQHKAFVSQMVAGSKKISISWQSMTRILAVQVLYRVFNRLTQLLGESMDTYIQFTIRIGEIQTISQKAEISTARWSKEVRELSDALGSPLLDVAEANYQAVSNQIVKGTQDLIFMREAQELALVSVSSLSDAVAASSSVINAFNLHVSRSAEVNAILFKTVELGRLRLSEMANSLGRVSKLSEILNISFIGQQASLATLTIQGLKFNVAQTLLSNIQLKLIKPTEKMLELFAEWGVTSGQAAVETFGFWGILQKMEQAAKTSGDELAFIGEVMGRLRAITGKTALSSEDLLKTMAKFEGAAEDQARAHEIMMNTVGKRWEIAINKIKNFFTEDIAKKVWKALEGFAGTIEDVVPLVKNMVNTVFSLGKALFAITIVLPIVNTSIWVFTNRLKLAQIATITLNSGLVRFTRTSKALALTLHTLGTVGIVAVITGLVLLYDHAARSGERLSEISKKLFDDLQKQNEIFVKKQQEAIDKVRENQAKILNDQFKDYFLFYAAISKSSSEALSIIELQFEKSQTTIASGWDIVAEKFKTNLDIIKNDLKANVSSIQKMRDALAALQADRLKQRVVGLSGSGTVGSQKAALSIITRIQKEGEQAALRGDEKVALARFKQAEDFFKLWIKGIEEVEKKQFDLRARGGVISGDADAINQLRIANIDLMKDFKSRQEAALSAGIAGAENLKKSQEEEKKFREENLRLAIEAIQKVKDFDFEDDSIEKFQQLATHAAFHVKRLDEAGRGLARQLELQVKLGEEIQKQREDEEKIKAGRKAFSDAQVRIKKINEDATNAASEEVAATKELNTLLNKQISLVTKIQAAAKFGQADPSGAAKFRKITSALKLAQIARDEFQKNKSIDNFVQVEDKFVHLQKVISSFGKDLFLNESELEKYNQFITTFEKLSDKLFAAERKSVDTQQKQIEAKENLDKLKVATDDAGQAWKDIAASMDNAASNIVSLTIAINRMIDELVPRLQNIPANLRVNNQPAINRAKGGFINGPSGTDTIPAWLTPGEYVWDAATTKKWFPLIAGLHKGKGFAQGGSVTNVGDISISVKDSGNPETTVRGIAAQIKREIRRGTLTFS